MHPLRRVPSHLKALEAEFRTGGIEVCHNAYTTQRRKEVYGPDANYFRLETWLEAANEADQHEGGGLRSGITQDGRTEDIGYKQPRLKQNLGNPVLRAWNLLSNSSSEQAALAA